MSIVTKTRYTSQINRGRRAGGFRTKPFCKGFIIQSRGCHTQCDSPKALRFYFKFSSRLSVGLTYETGALDTLYQILLTEEVKDDQGSNDHHTAGILNNVLIHQCRLISERIDNIGV